jgi:hypothetical protein
VAACFLSPTPANRLPQTTNLDGESNLKTRTALPATRGLTSDAALGAFKGVVKCGPPDEKIYKFDSQLRGAGDGIISLSSDQLMLQATHLRNTEFVFGIVVYTGELCAFVLGAALPGRRACFCFVWGTVSRCCLPWSAVRQCPLPPSCHHPCLAFPCRAVPCFVARNVTRRQRNQVREQQKDAAPQANQGRQAD